MIKLVSGIVRAHRVPARGCWEKNRNHSSYNNGVSTRQKSRLSIRTLIAKARGSHLSCQKSKMPETSAVCHLDTIAAYSMRGTWCTPSLLVKEGFAF